MKSTSKLVIFIFTFLALAASVYAQSPREQLKQSVEQLKANPSDSALRERIIRLAQQIKPAPAIPEEARRHFVKAVTLQKDAKNPSDYELVVAEYQRALLLAPWWSDALFNLSVAFEASGQLNDAMSTLKLYLLTNPGAAEARAAQDRLYSLEAKQEKLAKENAEREAAARAEQAKYGWLLGRWNDTYRIGRIDYNYRGTVEFVKSGSTINGVILEFQAPDGTMLYNGTRVLIRATIDNAGNLVWETPPLTCSLNKVEVTSWRRIGVQIGNDQRQITFREPNLWGHNCTEAEGFPHTLSR